MESTRSNDREHEARARVGLTLRSKWRLDALLGVGGMAAVYAATHRNGQRGAVKIMHKDLRDEDARHRFLREGRIANHVGHDGVVRALDDDVDEDGCPFLVMELLDGESLARRAARNGDRLLSDEVLVVAARVLEALAAAHDKGVIHRDIKPENLFATADGRVKLVDFGIAHLDEAPDSDLRATHDGSAMGTPAFMSPEQAHGRWDHVGPESDLWSLGATMFNLLTGELVHDGDSFREVLVATMTQPARSLAVALPGAPTPVVAIVDRALEMNVADRWHDAREMLEAVRAAYRKIAGEEMPRLPERRSPDDSGARAVALRRPMATMPPTTETIASMVMRLAPPRQRLRAAIVVGAVAAAAVAATLASIRSSPAALALAARSFDPSAVVAAPTASGSSAPAIAPPRGIAMADARPTRPAPPRARAAAMTQPARPTPQPVPIASATGPDRERETIFDRRY